MGTFDVVAEIKIEHLKMGNCHPAHKNSFVYGVLTGLQLGTARIRSGLTRDDKLEEILFSSLSLPDLIDHANDFIPAGSFFRSDMFVSVAYRTSMSSTYYCSGIKFGYEYVMKLEEEFEKVTGNRFTAVNLTVIHINDCVKLAISASFRI